MKPELCRQASHPFHSSQPRQAEWQPQGSQNIRINPRGLGNGAGLGEEKAKAKGQTERRLTLRPALLIVPCGMAAALGRQVDSLPCLPEDEDGDNSLCCALTGQLSEGKSIFAQRERTAGPGLGHRRWRWGLSACILQAPHHE